MTSGFVRGTGDRKEVELMDVLPPDLRGFSSQDQQLEFVKKYQHQTGVLVRLPWETEEQRQRRRESIAPAVVTQISGDPVRLKKALQRVVYQIETLTPDRTDYDTVLLTLAQEANKYEEALGLPPRVYLKVVPQRPKEPPLNPELLTKFKSYTELSEKKRRESADATTDIEFLKLIRDRESVADIVKVATAKLVKLGAIAA